MTVALRTRMAASPGGTVVPSSLVFNGTSAFVQVPRSAAMETPSTEITAWCWVKNLATGNAWAAAFHKNFITDGSTAPYGSYAVARGNNVTSLLPHVGHGTRIYPIHSNPIAVTSGVWYFAVVRLLGGQVVSRIFTSTGTLFGERTEAVPGPIAYDSGGHLRFGRNEGAAYFSGKIAYAGAHNQAFSDAQIDTIRTTGVPPVTPSAFHFPFQGGEIVDVAQGHVPSTVQNVTWDYVDVPPIGG
jgi:hypothetical protein